MKKASSGVQVGLYALTGVVGVYLLGGLLLGLDIVYGSRWVDHLPEPVVWVLFVLYVRPIEVFFGP
jgi:hypothetical protein